MLQVKQLSGQEFEVLYRRLGYLQKEIAQELGLDVRTIQRYETGSSAIPRSILLALREIDRCKTATTDRDLLR
jgi:transcriptional regulator with XRE-family HTH domain